MNWALRLAYVSCSKVSAGVFIVIILDVLFGFAACIPVQAQNATSFSPTQNFAIPAYHGSINFGVSGSYSTATLNNDTWTFTNLALNQSIPVATLKFSAQNCNVTIFSYQYLNTSTFDITLLTYLAQGHGVQILNFGINSTQNTITANAQWNVIFGTKDFAALGDGWTISPDGTLTITKATDENVTVLHYDFFNVGNQNLSFYQQHSVAITVVAIVAVTVAVAAVIKIKTREPSAKAEEKVQT